jgi:uncharacterized Tic20 family protein
MSESEERTWALVAHLSGLVLSIVGPLLILLIFGPRSAFLKDQSTEALNFQITVLVGIVVSLILTLVVIGIFLLVAVGITALVLQIIAALRAYEGVRYRYPINIRMVR